MLAIEVFLKKASPQRLAPSSAKVVPLSGAEATLAPLVFCHWNEFPDTPKPNCQVLGVLSAAFPILIN